MEQQTSSDQAAPDQVKSELAVMKTSDILNRLNDELAKMKIIEESKYQTNGKFPEFSVNIQSETLVTNILRAASVVIAKEEYYTKAAQALGLPSVPLFTLGDNYTKDDWMADFDLRIKIINQKETLDTLNTFKREMENFLSEADKKELLLNKMNDFFAARGTTPIGN